MANGEDYQSILDELIGMIRDDNEADSATVERLVQRLRELRALAGGLADREIIAGQGLAGGGSLSDDITIGLSENSQQALEAALSSVQTETFNDVLSGLATKKDLEAYQRTAAVSDVLALPFSHPDGTTASVTTPDLVLPNNGRVVWMSASLGEAGAAASFTVDGAEGANLEVKAGAKTGFRKLSTPAPVGATLRVKTTGVMNAGFTVMVGVEVPR